jgi:DNA-binding transcriptional ArsR family regulator
MARKRANGKKGGQTRKAQSDSRPQASAKKRSKHSSENPVNYQHMKALAHPLRLQILAILAERVASPKEISVELGEDLSQISYHVVVLRECGLIAEDHEAPRRGAVAHFYRAAAPTLIPPGSWDNLPPILRKGVSVSILQHFFEDASASMEAEVFDRSPGELSWTPLILDSLGVEEFGRLARDFLDSVLELQAKTSQRLPKQSGKVPDATSATVFLASFLSARSPEENKRASATKRR